MSATICRVVGGVLVVLIGVALAIGGIQLWREGPAAWPDVIANAMTVRRTSIGMIAMAAWLLFAGSATVGNVSWGSPTAAVATVAVVVAAFWANYALFGELRLAHTGTNFVLGVIILALLWFGSGGRIR